MKMIIKAMCEMCEKTVCGDCHFKVLCDMISDDKNPTQWNKDEVNKFLDIIRSVENDESKTN